MATFKRSILSNWLMIGFLPLLSVLFSCGGSSGGSGGGGDDDFVQESFELASDWACPTFEDCQDVYDVEFEAGSVVTFRATDTTGASVAQIALYGAGVALGGMNLFTGNTDEARCYLAGGCDGNPEGTSVEGFEIPTTGAYRLAITRNHGRSCGTSGGYTLIIDSMQELSDVTQTVDDQVSAQSGPTCP